MRIGFQAAGLHLTGLFVERAGTCRLYPETTVRGEAYLGVKVRLLLWVDGLRYGLSYGGFFGEAAYLSDKPLLHHRDREPTGVA